MKAPIFFMFIAWAIVAQACVNARNVTFPNQQYKVYKCKSVIRISTEQQYYLCRCFNLADTLNRPKIMLRSIPDSAFTLIEFHPR